MSMNAITVNHNHTVGMNCGCSLLVSLWNELLTVDMHSLSLVA